LAQGGDAGLDQEREQGELETLLLTRCAAFLAKRLEFGNVGLVELGDVRNGNPVAMQVGAGEFLDTRQRL
jgi:hypothetical protein